MDDDAPVSAGEQFVKLVEIMHRLRSECPWDRQQTHKTLRPYLLEETHEVLAALDDDRHDLLREELGDLLLQVVFHAELAAEAGTFTITEVVEGICGKLTRRHPHVFGDAGPATVEDVLRRWEGIKASVEAKGSCLEGVPAALPALSKAVRVLSKVQQVGIPLWAADEALQVVEEALAVLSPGRGDGPDDEKASAVGALLLGVALLARSGGIDAEDALRKAISEVEREFRREERAVLCQGRTLADLSAHEREEIGARLRRTCRGCDR
jgi:tetrapyrrole methylase family protein/MazG family protein